MRRPARQTAVVAAWAVLATAGCGGGPDGAGDGPVPGEASRAYAAQVTAITEQARIRLTEVSADADYRDAGEAAATTRKYAAGIDAAATELAKAEPPAGVAPQHAALVALYETTAEHMEEIAVQFAAAEGPTDLAARAQALSTEVQRLSTRENQLRTSIERDLAGTTPAGATTPPAG